jgi:hypothetical protein
MREKFRFIDKRRQVAMLIISDVARDGIKAILNSQHARGKKLVLYLQGAG